MKKRCLVVVLTLALIMAGGLVYAAPNGPSNPNAMWVGGSAEPQQGNAPVQYIRVRYALSEPNAPTLVSGTVVSWDTISADGYTISACIGVTSAGNVPPVAGVLISSILTDDVAGYQKGERSVGYMAVRGYCLALVDTSVAAEGMAVVPSSDSAMWGYFGTRGEGGVNLAISSDSGGTLLQDTGTDGLMPVVLK